MTVTNVEKDPHALTMTVTTEFDAPVERAWELWADPRQLERWWGPPTWPATFEQHDLGVGSTVTYFMTGPDGERARGWWRILSVDAPRHLELEDGFADADGNPDASMPVMVMRVSLGDRPGGGTRMVLETRFASVEAMDKILAMGMEEGVTLALGQIDDILAAGVRST